MKGRMDSASRKSVRSSGRQERDADGYRAFSNIFALPRFVNLVALTDILGFR